jgi:hypothetical protein
MTDISLRMVGVRERNGAWDIDAAGKQGREECGAPSSLQVRVRGPRLPHLPVHAVVEPQAHQPDKQCPQRLQHGAVHAPVVLCRGQGRQAGSA